MPEAHLNDVERDLARLLSLEPSHAFAAGVRTRVARAPRPHVRWAWAFAAAAGVMLGASATLVMQMARDVAPPAVSRPALPVGVVAVRSRAPQPGALPPVAGLAPPRATAWRGSEPEVIIDPAFNNAVERLLRAAQRHPDGAAHAVPEPAPPDPAITPMVVDELAIPVIKVTEPRSLSK